MASQKMALALGTVVVGLLMMKMLGWNFLGFIFLIAGLVFVGKVVKDR